MDTFSMKHSEDQIKLDLTHHRFDQLMYIHAFNVCYLHNTQRKKVRILAMLQLFPVNHSETSQSDESVRPEEGR